MARARTRVSPPLEAPVRPRYFDGRLLTAGDLGREQEYQRSARRRLSLLALGSGVVDGLSISVDADTGSVNVSPGIAIDKFGREVIVPEPVELCRDPSGRGDAFVVLSYAEEMIEPTPSTSNTEGVEYGAVRETYRLELSDTPPAPDDPSGAVVVGTARRAPHKAGRRPAKKKRRG